jgi:PRTRC genetic system ThiF family protein
MNGERSSRPYLYQHYLTICDGDVVEEKNIRRQNFVSADIGENKAAVLAARYSQAYGMEINCCDQYISSTDHLKQVCFAISGNPYKLIPVIVGCVDNNATRALIAQYMEENKAYGNEAYWLDGGNEEFSGQVILGSCYPRGPGHYNRTNVPIRIATPMVTQVYPEVLEVTDKRPDEMSCDDRAVSFPQCIATNITMATLMLDFCNHFINMPEAGLPSNMVTFDVKRVNFSTTFNTDETCEKARSTPIWTRPTLKVDAKEKAKAAAETAVTTEVTQEAPPAPQVTNFRPSRTISHSISTSYSTNRRSDMF